MMYRNKFVLAVKSQGKILREFKDQVFVPYGSEYSLLLKNLNSKRAQVKVSIDGTDVLNGNSLIVNANGDLELERFLKDNTKGNRFKFIERTSAVEAHRGVGAVDGLIRVEIQYEIDYPKYTPGWGMWDDGKCGSPPYGPIFRGQWMSHNSSIGGLTHDSYSYGNLQNVASAAPFNDVGITVPGSMSDQKFETVTGFTCDPEVHVIVLQMLGETETAKVTKVVTVEHKPKCVTCGTINRVHNKFCRECGTALEIV